MNIVLRKIYYSLPVFLRYKVRRIIYLPHDLFRKTNSLVPPKGLIFTGSGNYLKVGQDFFNYFKKYGAITPDSSILDIGSGIGRMAIPFTTYLSPQGKYQGFDIVKLGVDWCTNNISSRFPNFEFQLIPLKNDLYFSKTNEKAADLKFPYKEETFDFVFLTSVFTHMMPNDMENYIREIKRVLKKDKLCFATFFIMDAESKNSTNTNSSKEFPYDYKNYFLMDKTVKEANIAFDLDYIKTVLKKNDLEIVYFFKGNWSGIMNTELNEHQDILIFKKI